MSDVLGVAKVLKAEGEIDLCLAEGYAANRSYFVPLGELRWCIGENGYRCDIGLDGAPTRAVPVFKDGKIIKWCGTNFMTSTKRQLALPTGDMVSFGMANSDPLLERARAAAEALKAVGLPAVLLRPDRGSLSPIGSSRSCRRSTGVPVIVSG